MSVEGGALVKILRIQSSPRSAPLVYCKACGGTIEEKKAYSSKAHVDWVEATLYDIRQAFGEDQMCEHLRIEAERDALRTKLEALIKAARMTVAAINAAVAAAEAAEE